MTTDICHITTCKGRLAHLRQTLPLVVGQTPKVECTVVDYVCPDGTADWVSQNHPEVRVVRVADANGFNAPRARNLGAAATSAPWLAFFDADILWSPQFSATVAPLLRRGYFYRPDPVTPQTWGSVICHRDDFAAIGGYDEAFDGWGGEDDDLYVRLSMSGLQQAGYPSTLIAEIPHDDTLRMRYHAIKQKALQRRVNSLYLQVKLDLMRLHDRNLAFGIREKLYQEAQTAVVKAFDKKLAAAILQIDLPAQSFNPPPDNGQRDTWQINRKMTYAITLAMGHTAPPLQA